MKLIFTADEVALMVANSIKDLVGEAQFTHNVLCDGSLEIEFSTEDFEGLEGIELPNFKLEGR